MARKDAGRRIEKIFKKSGKIWLFNSIIYVEGTTERGE